MRCLRSKFNYKYLKAVKNSEYTVLSYFFKIVDEVNKQEFIQSHI